MLVPGVWLRDSAADALQRHGTMSAVRQSRNTTPRRELFTFKTPGLVDGQDAVWTMVHV